MAHGTAEEMEYENDEEGKPDFPYIVPLYALDSCVCTDEALSDALSVAFVTHSHHYQ